MTTRDLETPMPNMGVFENHAELPNIAQQMTELKLLEQRAVFISEAITSRSAKRFITEFLTLDAQGPGEPIKLYVNSPGGEVNSGFAIYDTIRFLQSPVTVINTGLCASIATIINISVPKERRLSMPNASYLIHQPLIPGQIYGQASDIEIRAREILKTRAKINQMLADACGKPLEQVEKDTVRDYWMSAPEAVDYGLVTKIVENVKEIG